VNLVYGFIGLQNSFDLDDFEWKRQKALNALVACCPRKSAPYVSSDCVKSANLITVDPMQCNH
jgi:telomere length regulation protein